MITNNVKLSAGLVLMTLFGFGHVAAAAATVSETPPDVVAALSAEAIEMLRADAESRASVDDDSQIPDFSTAESFGGAHQVYVWSSSLIAVAETSEPVSATEEWVAPILTSDGQVLGTYRVWRPTSDSNAEFAGFDNEIELAGALQKIEDGSALISDPAIDAWYALRDGSVTPLEQSAAREVPHAAPIEDVAKIVSARYAAAIRDSEEVGEGAAGGMAVEDRRPWYYGMDPWILAGSGLLLIAGLVGGVWLILTRKRAHA